MDYPHYRRCGCHRRDRDERAVRPVRCRPATAGGDLSGGLRRQPVLLSEMTNDDVTAMFAPSWTPPRCCTGCRWRAGCATSCCFSSISRSDARSLCCVPLHRHQRVLGCAGLRASRDGACRPPPSTGDCGNRWPMRTRFRPSQHGVPGCCPWMTRSRSADWRGR